ncbi:MAG: uncharacterized protein QOJ58_3280 [Alphaproteobacteria bacterium]|jgi:hypothetical protein|nr:uncharacterized protein [Alphaproteobacteria bacterium]
MTPEERNLVIELFDRLATLEDAQRDPDAERLIRDGLRQAPNASYALVQTVLVQDEALKRADARIRELEGEPAADAPRDNSFLGGVRDSLFGRREGRGSVPSVPRPEDARGGMSPAWRTGTPAMAPSAGAGMPMGASQPGGPMAGGPMAGGPMAGGPMAGGGGSFLGTAAAAAAGVVGGSLLLNGIRSMMGGQHGAAQAAFDPNAGTTGSSPWGGSGSSSGGDLSRQAGLDDIGRTPSATGGDANSRSYGALDDSSGNDVNDDQDVDDLDDGGFDSDQGEDV